ncbi:MAG TPA: bifunctional isocitrate dehydrogenase kinase/phosphatase [Gammaproteobacteria bacterium]|jgi:isocitrate dehydrogenase kinase/phosphatase|nr:bifunctional isocitrate dehydrogenase kinase/phosphatase [Acidiferrobacteraceae bacterium]HAA36471.1 bifunctional isocitrate dehydrogenase kinase/phosphatase [Gammaproteobacteria bacterium]HAF75236.1 bifunctional isocitrate dehydrogenase kinase/phosphatase [Gammaproteobacteria bacterium]
MIRDGMFSHHVPARRLLESEADPETSARILSDWIQHVFDDFYSDFRAIPPKAKAAFEASAFQQSLQNSRDRLTLYGERMHALAHTLAAECPDAIAAPELWDRLEQYYTAAVAGRYEADLALAFLHSVRRAVFMDNWTPVDYAVDIKTQSSSDREVMLSRAVDAIDAELIREMLAIPSFDIPFRDVAGDSERAADKVEEALTRRGLADSIVAVDVIRGGFFRNRGVYVVGRIRLNGGLVVPLILALLNDEAGIYIDAVLTDEPEAHNLFSTTRANFIVTNDHYHELAEFLHGIMPKRPLGLHYSSLGFNHFGKVAVMEELTDELARDEAVFDTSVGFPGTVAIGFQAPGSVYNLKVIRDHPTENYKWGDFSGVESVLEKYRQVHDINRTGSMLDNAIYYNVTLPSSHFASGLLSELVEYASNAVSLRGETVFFHHLIVQRKMIPLPVFLQQAPREDCERAVISLGQCIKNNMAANIFNRDLDGRNYGVGSHIRVYLFDYDALETFTDVKIRSNRDRFDGEEDIPGWFFEDGVVFLPEEIEVGLRITDPDLRRLFRTVHGDLLEVEYWQRIQDELKNGKVPQIQVYPDSSSLGA